MKSYRKISKRRLTVPLVLIAVTALLWGASFLLDKANVYGAAMRVISNSAAILTGVCPFLCLGFAIAGLSAAVRAKKAGEPKTGRHVFLGIAEIVLIAAGWFAMVTALAMNLK